LPEAKEVVGGYYLVDAPDDETALQIGQIVPGCIRLHRAASDLGHS